MALSSLLSLRNAYIVVDVAFACFIVSHFQRCPLLGRLRVKEQVIVGVSVVFDFRFAFIAVQEREVRVRAGCKAFRTAFAIIAYLLVKNVVPKHSNGCHSADWPEEEAQEALDKVQPHVLRQVIFFVTVT